MKHIGKVNKPVPGSLPLSSFPRLRSLHLDPVILGSCCSQRREITTFRVHHWLYTSILSGNQHHEGWSEHHTQWWEDNPRQLGGLGFSSTCAAAQGLTKDHTPCLLLLPVQLHWPSWASVDLVLFSFVWGKLSDFQQLLALRKKGTIKPAFYRSVFPTVSYLITGKCSTWV